MDKILSITEHIKEKERRKHESDHQQRSEVVKRTVQCSSCRLSCAMCGMHLNAGGECCAAPENNQMLNLCENCWSEYSDFLDISTKGGSSKIYWHNKEWIRLWSAWVEYQKAMKAFRNSEEFQKLLKDSE